MQKDSLLNNLPTSVLINAIDSTNSPLIITDNAKRDNPIIYANQAFLDLCGYDSSEIIGHNCRFLQGPDSDEKSVRRIRNAVKKGQEIRVNLKNYRKDGSMFWNDLLISPIKDSGGVITHFVGMQLDITKRVEFTEQLIEVQQQLVKSNTELEQFTYAASHDLQEPLRMITSYLQLINKRYGNKFDDNGKQFLDFASEGAERMQALINDLLTLSRVSTVTKEFKTVPAKDLIDKALLNLALNIEDTNARITINSLPEITVDSVQMVQLFQNLIGNAIKYRKSNEAPVINITSNETANDHTISIADNGIGIDSQYHDRIFTIFQRLHTRDEYEGTGIGLALCKKVIERHNGKIWVESDGKNGTTFNISLPKAKRDGRS